MGLQKLPHQSDMIFLAYTGMETDLIFNKGVDLPGFASYPLLESEDGRQILIDYCREQMQVARDNGAGVILESPTWVANRDRGAPLGYGVDRLQELNREAIALITQIRDAEGDLPTIISLNIGPRDDAYAPSEQMTVEEAEDYHAEQIGAVAGSGIDVVSAYTLAYPAEAIGIATAARKHGYPVVISFTVETDGRLPTGARLGEAITEVDAATDGYVSYYMINCAHPDHFSGSLDDGPWMQRLRGVVVNASRCSHAELDEAEKLDDGNPDELGMQVAEIRQRFPQINVVGGCCGTDMRHLARIAKETRTG